MKETKSNAFYTLLGLVKRIGFINKLLCKHDDSNHGWSYIKCKKCERLRYNPDKNAEILNKKLSMMENKGLWKPEDTMKLRMRSAMFN